MENNTFLDLFELDKVRFIIKDACGLDIAYAYDDLVFSEHGLFLIKFVDMSGSTLHCWFNREIVESEEIRMFDSLGKTASLNDTKLIYKGRFSLKQNMTSSEEIDIVFEDVY
jgi:hypothetical protein